MEKIGREKDYLLVEWAGVDRFRGAAMIAVLNDRSGLARFIENVELNRGGTVCMFAEMQEAIRRLGVEEYSE